MVAIYTGYVADHNSLHCRHWSYRQYGPCNQCLHQDYSQVHVCMLKCMVSLTHKNRHTDM